MSLTRSAIRTKVQNRIGDASGNFYGNTLYNDLIESVTITLGGLCARLAPNYYLTHASYTGVDDATDSTYEQYSFASNHRAFVQLERIFGTGAGVVYQPLRVVSAEDQDRYRLHNISLLALPDSLTNYEQTVAVWGTTFRVIPAPVNNSYEYRLKYLRKPVTLSADESTLDIPDEWAELVVLDVCLRALSMLGDDSTLRLIRELRDQEWKMMRDEYRRRDANTNGAPMLDQMIF